MHRALGGGSCLLGIAEHFNEIVSVLGEPSTYGGVCKLVLACMALQPWLTCVITEPPLTRRENANATLAAKEREGSTSVFPKLLHQWEYNVLSLSGLWHWPGLREDPGASQRTEISRITGLPVPKVAQYQFEWQELSILENCSSWAEKPGKRDFCLLLPVWPPFQAFLLSGSPRPPPSFLV